jgi:hypothetical protein
MRMLLGSLVCSVLVSGASAQWFPASPGPNITVVYPPQSPPVAPEVVVIHARPVEEFVPTSRVTYLIAFKNSVVRLAEQYWVSGKTIFYITIDHQQMTAPLDSVDRSLSLRLNSEQNVAFWLPVEPEKTIAQVHVVRKTAVSVHERCCCVSGPSPARSHASRASSAGN